MTPPRTEYAPDSSFGWLDHDAAAAERMREVLQAFEEKSTVDALGFSAIRDALHGARFKTIKECSPVHGYLDVLVERMVPRDPTGRPRASVV